MQAGANQRGRRLDGAGCAISPCRRFSSGLLVIWVLAYDKSGIYWQIINNILINASACGIRRGRLGWLVACRVPAHARTRIVSLGRCLRRAPGQGGQMRQKKNALGGWVKFQKRRKRTANGWTPVTAIKRSLARAYR